MERLKPELIKDLVLSMGCWGPVIYIVCNVFRPFLLFPAIVLGIAGGLAFGPLWGSVYLVAGTALGAALCFSTARLLGANLLRRSWPKLALLEGLNNQASVAGFKTVLMLRLAPVMPWDVVSFMAGLSKVRFWPYFWATVIGSIPGAVAFSYMGDSLPNLFEDSSLTAIGVFAVMAILILHNKHCQHS